MRVVLQVVDKASVKVGNEVVGKINKGYLLFVGILTIVLGRVEKKLNYFKS